MGARHGKAVDPAVFDPVFIAADVVPVRVRREGEKVEMIAGDLKGPLERPLRVADDVMIVQIAKVGFVVAAPG